MSSSIEIRFSSAHRDGRITFDESPDKISVCRIGTGFRIEIPIEVCLEYPEESPLCPMLSHLRGVTFTSDRSGQQLKVGVVKDDRFYKGAHPKNTHTTSLTWQGAFSDLALYEKFRDGRPPCLNISLIGEICYLFTFPSVPNEYPLRTEPRSVQDNVTVSYPLETWIKMLRELKMAENVFVEIPLSTAPPAPWDEVWKALLEAREAFERGGATSWKGCMAGIRLALESWQKIEKEDMGPGWKAPSVTDRQNRSKKQRIDNLRWHLLQFAHLALHKSFEEWTRDDAVLALSLLSSLLAERNP